MTDPEQPIPRDPRNQRSRFEIRLVLAAVALMLVGSALYVLLNGSPTEERRATDSSNVVPSGVGETAPARAQ